MMIKGNVMVVIFSVFFFTFMTAFLSYFSIKSGFKIRHIRTINKISFIISGNMLLVFLTVFIAAYLGKIVYGLGDTVNITDNALLYIYIVLMSILIIRNKSVPGYFLHRFIKDFFGKNDSIIITEWATSIFCFFIRPMIYFIGFLTALILNFLNLNVNQVLPEHIKDLTDVINLSLITIIALDAVFEAYIGQIDRLKEKLKKNLTTAST
jgi:hypothetical protein